LVAQTVTFQNPDRILKTVLIGTNPPGENAIPIEPIFFEHALKPINDLEDEYYLFFEPASEKSRQAAKESHDRIAQRLDRDLVPSAQEVFQRYFSGSGIFKEDKLNFREGYKTLQSPVLVISGDHDISFATENWFPLLKNAPTMQHIIFNNSGHGPQHQYPEISAGYINLFLA
jgi:pimeloyl-ACP methyl ester carboxylesterase